VRQYKAGIDKAQQIFDFIVKFAGEHGYAPTVREITEAFGIKSTSITMHYIRVLIKWKWIEREPKTARSIRIIHPLYLTFPQEDVERVFESLAEIETRKHPTRVHIRSHIKPFGG